MALKDRIKAKKETTKTTQSKKNCEYNISIKKVTEATTKVKNSADLGNIVKEFAKFLNSLVPNNAKITISGDFDLGQQTLLNCLIANFIEEPINPIEELEKETKPKKESSLIKKRKSVKARLKEMDSEE